MCSRRIKIIAAAIKIIKLDMDLDGGRYLPFIFFAYYAKTQGNCLKVDGGYRYSNSQTS